MAPSSPTSPRVFTDPESELVLRGPFEKENQKAEFKIKNPSDNRHIAFKIKSTKADLMAVSPKSGFLRPKEEISISVVLIKFVLDLDLERERRRPEVFLIQSAFVPDQSATSGGFLGVWKNLRPCDITETKLKIKFLVEELEMEDITKREKNQLVPQKSPPEVFIAPSTMRREISSPRRSRHEAGRLLPRTARARLSSRKFSEEISSSSSQEDLVKRKSNDSAGPASSDPQKPTPKTDHYRRREVSLTSDSEELRKREEVRRGFPVATNDPKSDRKISTTPLVAEPTIFTKVKEATMQDDRSWKKRITMDKQEATAAGDDVVEKTTQNPPALSSKLTVPNSPLPSAPGDISGAADRANVHMLIRALEQRNSAFSWSAVCYTSFFFAGLVAGKYLFRE